MFRIMAVMILTALAASAQAAPAVPDADAILRQFGPGFERVKEFPVLAANLESERSEDAVIVATAAENPLLDAEKFKYKVVDPMNAAFGFGDPRVTTQFAAPTGQHPKLLLIVFNWRAPRARFVAINLPFDKLAIGRLLVKKKVMTGIRAEETGGMASAIYWDGKKWKWQDLGIE